MKRQNLRTVSLIVITFTYLLIGAAMFGYLESDHEQMTRETLKTIENMFQRRYKINDTDLSVLTTTILKSAPHKAGTQWKFPGAFYFATTVVTTIGYGHSTPSTMQGRCFCMIYALIGIPLGLVMFQSIGERLNTFVGWALKYAKKCFKAKNPEVTQTNLVAVVSILSTILMTSMAAVFASYERWEYFEALYYCFITLTTIGFGDFVALQKDQALQDKPQYVILSLVFILFGLSVVSSAVNLLVLKFLTLNTEDERRDEQLRYTANSNPILLEGDVITPASRHPNNNNNNNNNSRNNEKGIRRRKRIGGGGDGDRSGQGDNDVVSMLSSSSSSSSSTTTAATTSKSLQQTSRSSIASTVVDAARPPKQWTKNKPTKKSSLLLSANDDNNDNSYVKQINKLNTRDTRDREYITYEEEEEQQQQQQEVDDDDNQVVDRLRWQMCDNHHHHHQQQQHARRYHHHPHPHHHHYHHRHHHHHQIQPETFIDREDNENNRTLVKTVANSLSSSSILSSCSNSDCPKNNLRVRSNHHLHRHHQEYRNDHLNNKLPRYQNNTNCKQERPLLEDDDCDNFQRKTPQSTQMQPQQQQQQSCSNLSLRSHPHSHPQPHPNCKWPDHQSLCDIVNNHNQPHLSCSSSFVRQCNCHHNQWLPNSKLQTTSDNDYEEEIDDDDDGDDYLLHEVNCSKLCQMNAPIVGTYLPAITMDQIPPSQLQSSMQYFHEHPHRLKQKQQQQQQHRQLDDETARLSRAGRLSQRQMMVNDLAAPHPTVYNIAQCIDQLRGQQDPLLSTYSATSGTLLDKPTKNVHHSQQQPPASASLMDKQQHPSRNQAASSYNQHRHALVPLSANEAAREQQQQQQQQSVTMSRLNKRSSKNCPPPGTMKQRARSWLSIVSLDLVASSLSSSSSSLSYSRDGSGRGGGTAKHIGQNAENKRRFPSSGYEHESDLTAVKISSQQTTTTTATTTSDCHRNYSHTHRCRPKHTHCHNHQQQHPFAPRQDSSIHLRQQQQHPTCSATNSISSSSGSIIFQQGRTMGQPLIGHTMGRLASTKTTASSAASNANATATATVDDNSTLQPYQLKETTARAHGHSRSLYEHHEAHGLNNIYNNNNNSNDTNKKETKSTVQRLACKCCCQHLECIQYALEAHSSRQTRSHIGQQTGTEDHRGREEGGREEEDKMNFNYYSQGRSSKNHDDARQKLTNSNSAGDLVAMPGMEANFSAVSSRLLKGKRSKSNSMTTTTTTTTKDDEADERRIQDDVKLTQIVKRDSEEPEIFSIQTSSWRFLQTNNDNNNDDDDDDDGNNQFSDLIESKAKGGRTTE